MVSSIASVLLAFVPCTPAVAPGDTDTTSDTISKIAGDYGWKGLLVSKIGEGISDLVAADVDGDGLGDLALVNNGRARIELLRRPKAGEKATDGKKGEGRERMNDLPDETTFVRESVPVEEKVSAIAFADLDGDKKPELIYLGDSGKVTIEKRGDHADYSLVQRLDVTKASGVNSALKSGDLDGDGKLDLVVLGVDDTYLFLSSGADKGGRFGEGKRLPNATRGADQLNLLDVDGDGKLDLTYAVGNSEWPIRFRLGKGGATFGPELASRFAEIRALVVGDFDNEPGAEAVAIRSKSGRLALLRYKKDETTDNGPLSQLRSVAFQAIKDADQREFVFGDIDGDHKSELLVVEPSAAQVVLYRDLLGGSIAPEIAASFSGVAKPRLADVDGDGRLELVVASAAERVIGVAKVDPKSGIAFPNALPIPDGGDVVALDAADLDGDKKAEIVIVSASGKGSDRKGALVALDEKGAVRSTFDLGKLPKDPADLWLIDVNRDGKRDALLFFPRSLPRLLLATADGKYADVKLEERGLGILNGLERTQLTFGDADGDGKNELIVPKGNFARAIYLDADGKPQTVLQLNLDDPAAQVDRVTLLDLDGDGKNELLVSNKTGAHLEVWAVDADQTVRKAKVDLAGVAPAMIAGADLDGDGRQDIVVGAADRLAVVKNGASDAGFSVVADFDLPLKNAFPDRLAVGDVNGDKNADVAISETVDHQLLFAAIRKDSLEYAIRFTIFETRIFEVERGGREPREVVVADCTGDGKPDVAIIVHDRVIVYPQE